MSHLLYFAIPNIVLDNIIMFQSIHIFGAIIDLYVRIKLKKHCAKFGMVLFQLVEHIINGCTLDKCMHTIPTCMC